MQSNQNDNQLDSEQLKNMATKKFKGACLKVSAILGISLAAAAILLSRPIASYISREFCYQMQPTPSYWPNPISGIWRSTWGLYKCEWAGNFGFNWYEVFAWISSSWQSILTSVGSCTGIYAVIKALNTRQGAAPSQQEAQALFDNLTDSDKQALAHVLQEAVSKGYFPSQSIEPPEQVPSEDLVPEISRGALPAPPQ